MCYHRHPPNLPPNAPNSPTLFSIKTTTGRRATRTAGLAMFSVLKAGFVFSGKAGSGLVIARLPDGSWSAPSCIATGGVGWGLQIGADITDFVIVLNSEEAVRAFALGATSPSGATSPLRRARSVPGARYRLLWRTPRLCSRTQSRKVRTLRPTAVVLVMVIRVLSLRGWGLSRLLPAFHFACRVRFRCDAPLLRRAVPSAVVSLQD